MAKLFPKMKSMCNYMREERFPFLHILFVEYSNSSSFTGIVRMCSLTVRDCVHKPIQAFKGLSTRIHTCTSTRCRIYYWINLWFWPGCPNITPNINLPNTATAKYSICIQLVCFNYLSRKIASRMCCCRIRNTHNKFKLKHTHVRIQIEGKRARERKKKLKKVVSRKQWYMIYLWNQTFSDLILMVLCIYAATDSYSVVCVARSCWIKILYHFAPILIRLPPGLTESVHGIDTYSLNYISARSIFWYVSSINKRLAACLTHTNMEPEEKTLASE